MPSKEIMEYFDSTSNRETRDDLKLAVELGDDKKVQLLQATFSTFIYPNASLILADASLFFCPENEFDEVWNKITKSLLPKGIFVGSFLGSEDTMAGSDYKREDFWPKVLVVSEKKIRSWLNAFDKISFTEHRTTGKSADGKPHQWHVFSVVARKGTTPEVNRSGKGN